MESQLRNEASRLLTGDPTNNKRVVRSAIHLSELSLEDKRELAKEEEEKKITHKMIALL